MNHAGGGPEGRRTLGAGTRLEREAQVLAQLQHPDIASIYGLEESGGVRALVMQLVGSEDLAERRGPRRTP